jgi:hypothetical protein
MSTGKKCISARKSFFLSRLSAGRRSGISGETSRNNPALSAPPGGRNATNLVDLVPASEPVQPTGKPARGAGRLALNFGTNSSPKRNARRRSPGVQFFAGALLRFLLVLGILVGDFFPLIHAWRPVHIVFVIMALYAGGDTAIDALSFRFAFAELERVDGIVDAEVIDVVGIIDV